MRISYSAMTTIEACPWRYYLQRKRVVGKPNNRNFLVGAVCDTLAQDWMETGWEKGWMQKHADMYFEEYMANNPVTFLENLSKETLRREHASDDRDLLWRRVKKGAVKIEGVFYRYGLVEKKLEAQRRGVVPFPDMPEHSLSGDMDFFDVENRDIYELKMTRNVEFINKSQLLMYAAIFSLADRKRVNRLYFVTPLKRKALVGVEYNWGDVKKVIRRAWGAIEVVRRGDMKPERGKHCWGCDYKEKGCVVWEPQQIDFKMVGAVKVVKL